MSMTLKQHVDHWLSTSNDSIRSMELNAIDEFNIAAKYASAKSRIYAKCTPQYVNNWATIIRKWHKTLKQQVMQLRANLPNNTQAKHPVDLK